MKELAKFKIDRLFWKGKPRLSFGYKSVGLPWKLLKLYPTVQSYLFFSSHSIVLFPLRTLTTWGSAKCIRKLYKVWRELSKFKMDMLFWKGKPRLSFGYKSVGLPWKLLKLYPTVHSYLLFLFTLYCIVSTKNTDNLREC